jgi:hypothetical protein
MVMTMSGSEGRQQRAFGSRGRDGSGSRSRDDVIVLESYRRRLEELRQDAALDTAWNEFLAAAEEAWSWRDPETLRVIEDCLRRLKTPVLRDWR